MSQFSDIIRVNGPDTFDRPIVAGHAIVTAHSADPVKVMTVRATGFEPVAATSGNADITHLAAVTDDRRSRFVASEMAASERPELSAARVVVSGGRVLGSSEKFMQVLAPLADTLGAALGASRAAVDAGRAPNGRQVGQTGRIVAPLLHVAVGISGAIQHLAGMKDSKLIVAIDQDADAPIVSVADAGLEADLFDAVPALTLALDGPAAAFRRHRPAVRALP